MIQLFPEVRNLFIAGLSTCLFGTTLAHSSAYAEQLTKYSFEESFLNDFFCVFLELNDITYGRARFRAISRCTCPITAKRESSSTIFSWRLANASSAGFTLRSTLRSSVAERTVTIIVLSYASNRPVVELDHRKRRRSTPFSLATRFLHPALAEDELTRRKHRFLLK